MRVPFVALGGGQEVGASCYFLKIKDSNILLDCGKNPKGDYSPDYRTILKPPFLESLSQITQIFISHGHYDHLGELSYLAEVCPQAEFYATPVTKALTYHLLWNLGTKYIRRKTQDQLDREEIAAERAAQVIRETGYFREIPLPDYQVSFYEAGHIPGAAMVHLTAGDRRILYTGDFTCQPSALTSRYILPKDLDFDTLILCGLHAKHPERFSSGYRFHAQMAAIKGSLEAGNPVFLQNSQLTKGWEVLSIMNNYREQGLLPEVPVYMDKQLFLLAEKMESLDIPVRKEWNYAGLPVHPGGALVIGSNGLPGMATHKIDFSLHPSFWELADFIIQHRPRTVVVVHAGKADRDEHERSLEEACKSRCAARFIYAKTGEIYIL